MELKCRFDAYFKTVVAKKLIQGRKGPKIFLFIPHIFSEDINTLLFFQFRRVILPLLCGHAGGKIEINTFILCHHFLLLFSSINLLMISYLEKAFERRLCLEIHFPCDDTVFARKCLLPRF
jgi:hypothetical protein